MIKTQIRKLITLVLFVFLNTNAIAIAGRITQTIHLTEGWNAIFIELDPENSAPDKLFKNLPIDQVFTYFPQKSSVQFIQEPDEIDIKQASWARWVPSEKTDAFLNSIYQILPGQAYLIHSLADYSWELRGKPYFKNQTWLPNSFNLKGFYVNPLHPPTFKTFFAHSRAHSQLVIYHLIQNHWQRITDLDTQVIRPGKAYWIYSTGGSNFNGPLQIDLPMKLSELVFDIQTISSIIQCRNMTPDPLKLTIQLINDETDCPIHRIKSTPTGNKRYQPLTTIHKQISHSTTERIPLAIRPGEISNDLCESVLKVYDDIGSLFYIPVVIRKN